MKKAILCARPKLAIPVTVLLWGLFANPVMLHAEGESRPSTLEKLDRIETLLAGMEEKHEVMLAKQQAVFQQLDQVRVWVRHRGKGKGSA